MGNSQGVRAPAQAHISTFYTARTWIDSRATDQIAHLARQPGVAAIAAFPDLHPGRNGPVGIACLADRIHPHLVGPDIGCGIALFRLDLPRRKLKLEQAARRLRLLEDGTASDAAETALRHAGLGGQIPAFGLGTLGGGNHFCEVQQVDSVPCAATSEQIGLTQGDLCLMVHSGSRGHGGRTFDTVVGVSDGLLPETDAAQDYLRQHDLALRWARLNRSLIAQAAATALRCTATLVCDTVHNAVTPQAGHWLHRKGAAAPDRGLAPLAGSRESLSYLLACADPPAEALGSLSHGAGRRHDRSSMHGRIPKTRSSLTGLTRTRFGGHVLCEDRDLLIEEAGPAYKNAAEVVADLQDCDVAQPVLALAPLITFKTVRTDGPEKRSRR